MDISEKARILYDGSKYDLYKPNGCVYKTLMTNECSYDCKYCANTTNCQKATFAPEELAKFFMNKYNSSLQDNSKEKINGLFLSSAIGREVNQTTEEMLKAVSILRHRYHFQGFIHFKVLPGVNFELIKQASEMVDRMSINIEAPSKSRLSEFCSVKEFHTDIIRRQKWIKKLKIEQTTQLVVGANDETDLEILRMIDWQNKNIDLKRGYFSSFFPIAGTEYENKEPASLTRQNRLYNVDFLLRLYGTKISEVKEILNNEMLPRNDPKLEIAKKTLGHVNLKEAKYEDIIKVPGIGPKTAEKIQKLKTFDYEALKKSGVIMKRAMPFIKFGNERQTRLA